MASTIAVISTGAMGSAVAARLAAHGCTVLTNLDGRSSGSYERARNAGAQVVPLNEVVSRAEWILSIVPPDRAESFAQQVFDVFRKTEGTRRIRFADCNATNPTTVKRIAALAAKDGVPFVDACIIGGPPREDYDPMFYASSSNAALLQEFGKVGNFGLKISLLEGEGVSVGDASALKMSYAGITKGLTGLTTTMILSAYASSPATAKALLNEMASSQPAILKRCTWSIPDAFPKAYRFEGEMREISDFVKEQLGPGESQVHEGLASVYGRLVGMVNAPNDELEGLKAFVDEGKNKLGSPS